MVYFSGVSKASLLSPMYGQVDSKCEITFAYHKMGGGIGALRLNIYTNVAGQPASNWVKTILWSETASLGPSWNTATVGLHTLSSNFILEFEAIKLFNTGDMAVDDISFNNCKPGERAVAQTHPRAGC